MQNCQSAMTEPHMLNHDIIHPGKSKTCVEQLAQFPHMVKDLQQSETFPKVRLFKPLLIKSSLDAAVLKKKEGSLQTCHLFESLIKFITSSINISYLAIVLRVLELCFKRRH